MTKLYAHPYDISARGFYFDSAEEYSAKAVRNRNSFGGIVEEYEIQFIDGDAVDAALFEALSVNQVNFSDFFAACNEWGENEKVKVIVAVGEAGYSFDLACGDPGQLDVDLYICDSLRDLAIQFVEEGLFGEIPAAIQNYVDYDGIGRDLGADYACIMIAGTRYVYRCG